MSIEPDAADDTTTTSSVTVDAPADEVWELLIDDDELSTWLGDEVVLDPVPGGQGTVTDDEGVARQIRVDDVDPGHSISWRWWPAGDDTDGAASLVEITLVPSGGGTEIRVVETVCSTSAMAVTVAATAVRGPAGATSEAWSDRLLSAELTMLCRSTVLAGVGA